MRRLNALSVLLIYILHKRDKLNKFCICILKIKRRHLHKMCNYKNENGYIKRRLLRI